jgi:hypothetical protein
VEGSSYAGLENGIYFIRPSEKRNNPTLDFLSLVQLIAAIARLAVYRGLSVFPDHRYALLHGVGHFQV